MKIPPPEIYDPKPFYETVKAVRAATSLLIIGKLSAIFHLTNLKWVEAGIDEGLDAIEVAYTQLINGLEKYFEENNTTLEEIKGLTVRKVAERKEKGWQAITSPIPPVITEEKCNACKICEKSCIYNAITVTDIIHIDKQLSSFSINL